MRENEIIVNVKSTLRCAFKQRYRCGGAVALCLGQNVTHTRSREASHVHYCWRTAWILIQSLFLTVWAFFNLWYVSVNKVFSPAAVFVLRLYAQQLIGALVWLESSPAAAAWWVALASFFTLKQGAFYLLSSNDARSAHTGGFDDVICAAGSSDYGRPKGGEGRFILREVNSFETTGICCSKKKKRKKRK